MPEDKHGYGDTFRDINHLYPETSLKPGDVNIYHYSMDTPGNKKIKINFCLVVSFFKTLH